MFRKQIIPKKESKQQQKNFSSQYKASGSIRDTRGNGGAVVEQRLSNYLCKEAIITLNSSSFDELNSKACNWSERPDRSK